MHQLIFNLIIIILKSVSTVNSCLKTWKWFLAAADFEPCRGSTVLKLNISAFPHLLAVMEINLVFLPLLPQPVYLTLAWAWLFINQGDNSLYFYHTLDSLMQAIWDLETVYVNVAWNINCLVLNDNLLLSLARQHRSFKITWKQGYCTSGFI